MILGILVACSEPVDAEAAWLQELLLRADAPYLADPERLSAKYDRMEADPYDFVRGSLAVFHARAVRPGADRPEIAVGDTTDADAAAVLLFGDAHPENLGTCRAADGTQSVEIVDLDAAAFGPWTLDVRRAALGLATLAAPLCDCGEDALVALADGYADGLGGLGPAPTGDALRDALDEAEDEGEVQRRLREQTTGVDTARRFRLDEWTLAPTLEQDAEIDAILALWEPPRGFRRLDAAVRLGTGVASLPARRYEVAFDRGVDGAQDDDLIELRQVIDPPVLTIPAALFDDGADRMDAAEALWTQPAADPLASAVQLGAMTFKITSDSSWFLGINRGALDEDDLIELSADLGWRIGHAHARSAGAVELRGGELGPQLLTAAAADLESALADYERFIALRERHGPLLGFDALPGDVR